MKDNIISILIAIIIFCLVDYIVYSKFDTVNISEKTGIMKIMSTLFLISGYYLITYLRKSFAFFKRKTDIDKKLSASFKAPRNKKKRKK